MKVLQVIDSLGIGGAEKMFVTLTNLLHQKGVDVHYLVFTPNTTLEKDILKEVPKVSYTRTSKFSYKSLRALAKIINQYDIVHVHMRHVFRYVQLVAKLFRVSSKIIFHDHYGKIMVDKKVPFGFKSFLKPKYYIGVSKELTNWAKQHTITNEEHIFLLGNVVERAKSTTTKKEGIVLVGNIKDTKNQLFAINLIAQLNITLTIVGNIQDEVYFETILARIKELDISDKVRFIHNETNIQSLLPNFKLGLLTSKSESGPLVLIEYLAQNLPFLAYKTGEVSDILYKDLPNSFITNFNEEEWIRRVQTIETTEVENFNEIYQRNFSSENYRTQCLKIYQQILNS